MNTFTVTDAAKRWRCPEELVREFLADFADARFIEKTGLDAWRVTPKGIEIAVVLGHVDDREQAA